MHSLTRRLVSFVAIGAVVFGCSSGPSAPDTADPFTGTWTGSVLDDRFGAGVFRLRITGSQRAGRLPVGEWSVAFAEGFGTTGTAPPYANAADGGIVIFVTCASGSLGLKLGLEGTILAGTYLALSCPWLTSGTVTLAKPGA